MNKKTFSLLFRLAPCLLYFVFFCPENVIAGKADTPTSATIDIFFTGKRRSNLEPCGCRSRQASGLQYEATLYDQLANTSSSIRIDTGEWTNVGVDKYPVDAMKTRYLLRGMKMMGLDAVGLGQTDISLSPEFFKSLADKYPQEMPYLVSAAVCVKGQPERIVFPASRIIQRNLADGTSVRIGITSVMADQPSGRRLEPFQAPYGGPTNRTAAALEAEAELAKPAPPENYTIKPAREVLASIVAELRPRVDLLVVLYSGDMDSARKLVQVVPQIDCLVINGTAVNQDTLNFQENRTAILMVRENFGREVGRARLARTAKGEWILSGKPEFMAVGPEFPPKKSLLDLLEEFKNETRTLEVALPGPNVPKIYAGAAVCGKCHAKEYESWKKTRHARAMQTLTDKGQQFNPECLKCHVTGYRQANGFYTLTHGPSVKLANVQCEQCHGSGRDHADTQQKLKDNVKNWMDMKEYDELVLRAQQNNPQSNAQESICVHCHTNENDGNFVYAKRLETIIHQN